MTAIDVIRENWQTLKSEGNDRGLSGLIFVEEMAAKTLIVAAAGEYEINVTRNVLDCFEKIGVPLSLTTFARRQGLDRKYHTLFDWDQPNNVNKFLAWFGEDFKKLHAAKLEVEPLPGAVKDFIFINATRNDIVHKGFARVSIECTFDEAWERYLSGTRFVDYIRDSF